MLHAQSRLRCEQEVMPDGRIKEFMRRMLKTREESMSHNLSLLYEFCYDYFVRINSLIIMLDISHKHDLSNNLIG